MIAFPLIAAGVSAVFSAQLLRSYARRHRLPQLAWGIALAQFAVASIVVAIGISGGWTSSLYKLYWVFGALLNVPWLALGSIALLNNRVLSLLALALVLVGSVFGLWKTFTGDVADEPLCDRQSRCVEVLGSRDIPTGRDAWRFEPSVRRLASLYSIPAFIVVVGIAALTSRPRRGVRPPAERVRGNLLIAVGVTIVAVGGSALARLAQGAVFSVTLALGVVVMFVGFLSAGRPARHRVEDPGDSPT